MKAIVDGKEYFTYMKLQPGDGTLYTVIFGIVDDDNLYLAIGPGDYIAGGYFFRASSSYMMLEELHQWIINDKGTLFEFLDNYHWINYMEGKFFDGHSWTPKIACLVAAVIQHADASNSESYELINAIDHNDSERVLGWLKEWGIVVV